MGNTGEIRGTPSHMMPWYLIIVLIVITQWGIIAAAKLYTGKAHAGMASVRLKQKDYTEAEREAKTGTTFDPYDGYGWFQYGAALYLQGRFAEAIPFLRTAIPILPHEYNAVRLLGFSEFYTGDIDRAVVDLEKYFLMNPAPAVTPAILFQRLGLASLRLNNLGDSLYFCSKSAHSSDEKTNMLRVRAAVSLLLNMTATSDYNFRLFKSLYPTEPFKPAELVTLAQKAKKLPNAIEYLKFISVENSDDASITQALAIAYAKNGNLLAAEETFQSAIAKKPDDALLRLSYGEVLFEADRRSDALIQYEEHLRLDPKSKYRDLIEKKKATPEK